MFCCLLAFYNILCQFCLLSLQMNNFFFYRILGN